LIWLKRLKIQAGIFEIFHFLKLLINNYLSCPNCGPLTKNGTQPVIVKQKTNFIKLKNPFSKVLFFFFFLKPYCDNLKKNNFFIFSYGPSQTVFFLQAVLVMIYHKYLHIVQLSQTTLIKYHVNS
jgi:hypothetical protein